VNKVIVVGDVGEETESKQLCGGGALMGKRKNFILAHSACRADANPICHIVPGVQKTPYAQPGNWVFLIQAKTVLVDP
jgi:hypothetical protein